jgi:hypothetical protein
MAQGLMLLTTICTMFRDANGFLYLALIEDREMFC